MAKTYRLENNQVVEVITIPEAEELRVVDSVRFQEKIDNTQALIDRLTAEKVLIEIEEAKIVPEPEPTPEPEI